jgi:predicted RNA-binding Zn-ribbon protein involved in translation (DUF1610 family)
VIRSVPDPEDSPIRPFSTRRVWIDRRGGEGPPPSDDSLPMVPYVPFRCPSCGRHKPRTENVRGRVRRHTCMACGTRYRSLEMPAGAVDPNFEE